MTTAPTTAGAGSPRCSRSYAAFNKFRITIRSVSASRYVAGGRK